MLENDILYSAIENLKKLIHLPVQVEQINDRRFDAIIHIGKNGDYHAEIKRDVHRSNLPGIMEQLSELIKQWPLLIAKSISASAKEILREKQINYIDMAGNCFIQDGRGLYIQIEGKKADLPSNRNKHSAFNKNGIKLIYALLLNDEIINESYSKIAEAANISKSTVGSILQDLSNKGFLIKLNKDKRKFTNKKELLERWVYSYNEKLKPTLKRGQFRFIKNHLQDWKSINLTNDAFWGGEPAADLLTQYLSPGTWTIYSDMDKKDLVKKLNLVQSPREGEVKLYRIFWNRYKYSFIHQNRIIAHPLLVYADLLATMDSRNFETATKVYEAYLSSHFSE